MASTTNPDLRPIPHLILGAEDPHNPTVGMNIVAIPLTSVVVERVLRQIEHARELCGQYVEGIIFALPEARYFMGWHPTFGWSNPADADDDVSERDEDAVDRNEEIPEIAHELLRDGYLVGASGIADETVLQPFEEIESKDPRLIVTDQLAIIEVGEGTIGFRLHTTPVPEDMLLWGRLYWQEPGERDRTFRQLAEIAPTVALDLLEHGFVIRRHAKPSFKLPLGPIEPASLQPLLANKHESIRIRAVSLVSQAGRAPKTTRRRHG